MNWWFQLTTTQGMRLFRSLTGHPLLNDNFRAGQWLIRVLRSLFRVMLHGYLIQHLEQIRNEPHIGWPNWLGSFWGLNGLTALVTSLTSTAWHLLNFVKQWEGRLAVGPNGRPDVSTNLRLAAVAALAVQFIAIGTNDTNGIGTSWVHGW